MTEREQAIDEFQNYLVRCTSRGNRHAIDALRDWRLKTVAGYCFEAEQADADVESYVRRKCRFNPAMWIMIFGIVMDIVKLWLEWRKPHETWGHA